MNEERGQKAVAPGTQKGRPRNDDVHFQRDGRVALKVLRRHAEHRPHHRGAQAPQPAEAYRGAVGAAPFGVSPKVSPRV